jgi:hypothetical protein
MVANSLNCMQRRHHDIDLRAYLGRLGSSNLRDVLAYLIIVPNWDLEAETTLPQLVSFIIHDLTCRVLEDVPHPEQPQCCF